MKADPVAHDLEAGVPAAPAAEAAEKVAVAVAAVAAIGATKATPEIHDLEAAPAASPVADTVAAVAAAATAVAAAAVAMAEKAKAKADKSKAAEEEQKQVVAAAAAVAAAAKAVSEKVKTEEERKLAAAAAAEVLAAAAKVDAAAEMVKAEKAQQKQKAPVAKKVAEEEDPRLRWAFVRKVYAILSLQFALTAAVAATACLVRPIPRFFVHGPPAAVWPTFIVILVSPLIVMFPMLKYREKHPRNLVLLALFTLCCSLSIAVSASTTLGAVVLQATILTAASVVGLTLFTFWAVKRGYDFTFTGPFLFTCLLVLLVYITIQVFFPLGRVAMTIYGFLATLVFSGFIVYDTNMLLKRHTYNEYVVAAISLYLDVINLFMAQMTLSCN